MTRLSLPMAFTLAFYLLGLMQCYGRINRNLPIVLFIFAIMAFSKAGDAFSVDNLIKKIRKKSRPWNRSGEYTWPIKAVWLLLSIAFFSAAISKLKNSGFHWMTSDTLSYYLTIAHIPPHVADSPPPTKWSLLLAQQQWLVLFLSINVMILELTYPLAMFIKKIRPLFVFCGIAMTLSFHAFMGPPVIKFAIFHLFWIPWAAILFRFGLLEEKDI